MDIEEYLEQKRSLEAKKELLEAKERLKEDGEKKKKELDKERKKSFGEKPSMLDSSRPTASRTEPDKDSDSGDMMRKLVLFNIIVLVLIVLIFGTLYFLFPLNGKGDSKSTSTTNSNSLTGGSTVDTTAITSNTSNKTTDHTTQQDDDEEGKTSDSEKYPGPEFDFFAEDKQLGKFDKNGKLGGENLVISSSYYSDPVLHLENKEPNVAKCFVDRRVAVDENLDGDDDLTDVGLDLFVYELDPGEKYEWDDSIPGSFEQGTYNGEGRVVVDYDARCYFCIDKFCDKYDKNGETKESVKIRFKADPDAASNNTS